MKLFTTLCAAALLIGGALYAQSAGDHIKVHFNTPVTVGETTFPAGDCDIQILHGSSDKMLLMRSETKSSTAVIANVSTEYDADTPDQVTLVLDRNHDVYHLSRILLPGHTIYRLSE